MHFFERFWPHYEITAAVQWKSRTPFFVVMIQGDLTRSTKTKLALIMDGAALS